MRTFFLLLVGAVDASAVVRAEAFGDANATRRNAGAAAAVDPRSSRLLPKLLRLLREPGQAAAFQARVLHEASSAARRAADRRTRTTMRPLMTEGPKVAVLGAGFGGLYTALQLASQDWYGGPAPSVSLVDASGRFSFAPMLYELATGTATAGEVAPRYADLLAGTGVELVRGRVTGLEDGAAVVRRADSGEEERLPYDYCVLALGAKPALAAVGIPGVQEYALPFATAADALELRRRVQALEAPFRVSVVGGGYVGVELAANLAALDGAEVALVHRSGDVLGVAQNFSRSAAKQRLLDAGVELVLDTAVTRVDPRGVTLEGRGRVPADLVVWTAGTKPAPVLKRLGLPTDKAGRLEVDATLRVRGQERIFALGDGAAVPSTNAQPEQLAPATAQAAMQQSDVVAQNIRATERAEPLERFRYTDLGEMLSLGEDAATIASLDLVKLDGPLAAAGRRAVYAARMPTTRQASKVGVSWAIDTAFRALRQLSPPQEKK